MSRGCHWRDINVFIRTVVSPCQAAQEPITWGGPGSRGGGGGGYLISAASWQLWMDGTLYGQVAGGNYQSFELWGRKFLK